MTETINQLIPILRFLAVPGAGIVASLLFAELRSLFPQPAAAPAARLARLLLTLLYAPRWSRISVLILASAIGLIFGVPLALLEARPVMPVVDAALAALISQVWHAFSGLSGDLPLASAPGVYAGLQERLNEESP
jgi:hypothetical protein